MSGVAPAARAPHEAHVEGVAGSVGAGAGLAGSAVPAAHLRTRARRPAPAQRRVTAARPSGGSRAPCVGRPAARPSQRGAVSWHSPSAPGAAHAARDGRACARAPVLAGGLRERRQGGDERAVPGAPAGPAGGWRLRGAGRGRGLARRWRPAPAGGRSACNRAAHAGPGFGVALIVHRWPGILCPGRTWRGSGPAMSPRCYTR